jgi:hypothetical protein
VIAVKKKTSCMKYECFMSEEQRYFCGNAVPDVPSHKDANRNGVLEPFLPGIGITNSPSPT